ncbi:MAG: SCO family protein [Candidatus Rokuibacteriota bacterium]
MNRLAIGALMVLAATAVATAPGLGHPANTPQRLSKIGPAPDFTLTTQDGGRLSLKDLHGKVVVVTFIYASCADTCPLLTAKLAALAQRLGGGGAPRVHFVGITVDPERDTPDILKHYARRHGAEGNGWTFLTGSPAEIREVARGYGVYVKKSERGDVDHTFLTSLIDRSGTLRVQYMGVRFDPDEMLRDVRSLLDERAAR